MAWWVLLVSILAASPAEASGHTCEGDDGVSLHVVTLNTWGLPRPLAPNRRGRLPRIEALLRQADVDFVGLQEVWSGARRHFLTEHVRMPESKGDSGLAVMTKHAITGMRVVPFRRARGFDAFKRKGVVDVAFEHPEVGPVRVLVTHLQSGRGRKSAEVRADQVDQLLELLADVRQPVLVLGDFNLYRDLPVDAATLQRLAGAGLVDAMDELGLDVPTYPADGTRLDRVYLRCSDRICLHPEAALSLLQLEPLSDHNPVHVRFRAHRKRAVDDPERVAAD